MGKPYAKWRLPTQYTDEPYKITMEAEMGQWVQAGTIDNRFEGDRVSQAMGEAGIPYMVKSFLDTAYDGLYIPQKGWGRVMVPEEWREKAEGIIAEVKIFFQKEGKDETE